MGYYFLPFGGKPFLFLSFSSGFLPFGALPLGLTTALHAIELYA